MEETAALMLHLYTWNLQYMYLYVQSKECYLPKHLHVETYYNAKYM